LKIIASKYSLIATSVVFFLTTLFTTAQTTYNFASIGASDSGQTGYKTVSNIPGVEVSNNMDHDSTEIYVSGGGATTEVISIRADNIITASFDFLDMNIYSFITSTYDAGSKIELFGTSGQLLREAALDSDTSLSSNGTTSIASFFDNYDSSPLSDVQEIRLTIITSSGSTPEYFIITSLTLDNLTPPVVNTPPIASNVSVTGTTVYGNTLTATYDYSDVESDIELGTTYQWYSADNVTGTINNTPIIGATNLSLIISGDLIGKYISFEVIPRDTEGGIGGAIQTPYEGVVVPKSLTVSGVTANDKVYDKTNIATVTGTGILSGVINGDDVSLSGSPTFYFDDDQVGNNRIVNVTGYTLSGSNMANYQIIPLQLTADIAPRVINVAHSINSTTKVYDATTVVTDIGLPQITGIIPTDIVNLDGVVTANTVDTDVENDKQVTFSGYTLSGTDASNYILSYSPGIISIVPLDLEITGLVAEDKIYDATTDAIVSGTPSLVGVLGADEVVIEGDPTAVFAQDQVGDTITVSITGYHLSGAQEMNYSLELPHNLSANITAKEVTFNGDFIDAKIYDATDSIEMNNAPQLIGVENGDFVFLSSMTTFRLGDVNVGNNQPVIISNATLNGVDSTNYTLRIPSLTSQVLPSPLIIVGITAENKTYDTSLEATVVGTPTLYGVLADDDVVLSSLPSYSFITSEVGVGKPVRYSTDILSGDAISNYYLSHNEMLKASIYPIELSLSGVQALTKIYDGTTNVEFTGQPFLEGVLEGDSVQVSGLDTASFQDNVVAEGKMVTFSNLGIIGADATNYYLGDTTLTGQITPKPVTIKGVRFRNKIYDETTDVDVIGELSLSGVLEQDVVDVLGVPTYVFSTEMPGVNIPIIVEGLSLSGTDATNYQLDTSDLSATIFESFNTEKVSIYPNPVNDELKLSSDRFLDKVELFDIEGKLLLTSPTVPISLKHLPKGSYILKLYFSGSNTNTIKLLKL